MKPPSQASNLLKNLPLDASRTCHQALLGLDQIGTLALVNFWRVSHGYPGMCALARNR